MMDKGYFQKAKYEEKIAQMIGGAGGGGEWR